MRVLFLRRSVVFAAFIASSLLYFVHSAPAPKPMMPSDLDNLRRLASFNFSTISVSYEVNVEENKVRVTRD
uniref:Neur_chan_LBD domain-containing protein n=1 Tax=Ascaris lumbricoides TaxID=6252 RepID=A0A0M3ITU7_ASCLU